MHRSLVVCQTSFNSYPNLLYHIQVHTATHLIISVKDVENAEQTISWIQQTLWLDGMLLGSRNIVPENIQVRIVT